MSLMTPILTGPSSAFAAPANANAAAAAKSTLRDTLILFLPWFTMAPPYTAR
jgi:hypothetical protein